MLAKTLVLVLTAALAPRTESSSTRGRALTRPDPTGAKIKECFLVNLGTNATLRLDGDDEYDYTQSTKGWSIKCFAGEGNLDYAKFIFDNENTTQYFSPERFERPSDQPFWMKGDNRGDQVNAVPYLNSGGMKKVDVKFYTYDGGDAFPVDEKSYILNSIGKCDGVACPANAACDPKTGSCVCFPNFILKNGVCVPRSKCDGVTCPINAFCDENSGSCTCKDGFVLKSGVCVPRSKCDGVTCPINAVCDENTGSCICKQGLVPKNGVCVVPSKCDGVTCPINAYCDENNGSCVCKEGFVLKNGVCVPRSKCDGVSCPAGSVCDESTGSCVCTGRPLFFDEKPCLSGFVNNLVMPKKCDVHTIIQLLQVEFNRRHAAAFGGLHRNLRDQTTTTISIDNAQRELTWQFGKGCPWHFNYELQLITKTLTYEKALLALGEMCSNVEPTEVPTTEWTDIDSRLTPSFMNEYTDGGTDLNNKIGNFKNPPYVETARYPTDAFSLSMGVSIDKYYYNGARTTTLKPLSHLNQCKHQTIMCCFGNDRQSDDHNGSCSQHACDNAKPTDNADVCVANRNGFRGDVNCHGFAWSNNPNSLSNKMRFNNFFYVSMYLNMYSRGYVRSVFPGTKMCGCIEDMPVVSRADCSEVVLNSDYKLTVTAIGDLKIKIDLTSFEFNACQGYFPGTKGHLFNDLLGHVEKLYQENKMDIVSRQAINRNLVQNCHSIGAGYRD